MRGSLRGSLVERETVPDVPANDILFRPSVRPYAISWLKYDPAAEASKFLAEVVAFVKGVKKK